MQITFDSDKDAANVAKHALSLTLARELEWDTLQWKEDTRRKANQREVKSYVENAIKFQS